MSCDAIDSVVGMLRSDFGLEAKISGAGGGGCLIIFPPSSPPLKPLMDVIQEKICTVLPLAQLFYTGVPTEGLLVSG